jgi:hypothetical protein
MSGSGGCCWRPRHGCWATAVCGPWPRWPGSVRPPSARVSSSWKKRRSRSPGDGSGAGAGAASAQLPWMRFWCLPCWRWWSRTSAATPNRRCGGPPSHWGTWRASWPGGGIRCRRPWPAACCARTASACRATPRRWRETSTRTGTRSSGTSTSRPRTIGQPASR